MTLLRLVWERGVAVNSDVGRTSVHSRGVLFRTHGDVRAQDDALLRRGNCGPVSNMQVLHTRIRGV
jgi:hypothetical protein